MAIPTKIKQLANKVRTEIYGKDVRESIAESMEETGAVSDEANQRSIDTEGRQTHIEARYDVAVSAHTEDSELLDLRVNADGSVTYDNAKQRIDADYTSVSKEIDKTNTKIKGKPVNIYEFENLKVVAANGYDWSQAINTAIEEGFSVEIPDGEFDIYSPIYPKKNRLILGYGNNSIINVYGDAGIVFSGENGEHTQVADLHVIGRVGGTTLVRYHDDDSGWAMRWAMRNVKLMTSNTSSTRSGTVGIELHGGWIADIYNPMIQFCDIGIKIIRNDAHSGTSFNALNIFGGEIQGNNVGVEVNHSLGVNFFGTAIEGNRRDGVKLNHGSRMISFNGCYFESNGIDDKTGSYEINISVENPPGDINGITVNDCIFLKSSYGAKTAINLERGRLLVRGSTRFITYEDDIPTIKAQEPGGNLVGLYVDESVTFNNNFPINYDAYGGGFRENDHTSINSVLKEGVYGETADLYVNVKDFVANRSAFEYVISGNGSTGTPWLRVNVSVVGNDSDGANINLDLDGVPNVAELVTKVINLDGFKHWKGKLVKISVRRLGNYPSDDYNGDITISYLGLRTRYVYKNS